MSEIETSFSAVGKILNQDVYNNYGLLLLSEGTVLSHSDISLLFSHKIYSVSVLVTPEIQSDSTSQPVQLDDLLGKYDDETGKQYINAMDETKSLFSKITEVYIPPLEQFTDAFFPLLHSVLKKTGFLQLLHVIEGAEDYTYRHSINVGLLSALIAKLMDRQQEEVILMGQAGLMHDVGKMLIPEHILIKPGKLTEEEFAIMKQHTILGADSLRLMEDTHEVIVQCALFHHERCDGSGYPEGRLADSIPIEAQIVGVADMFDAICSDRIYKTRTSPFEAAQILWQLTFDGKLNPEIVSPFINYIAQLYVGAHAVLSNGELAEVVLIHTDEPMRPLIRQGEVYTDLRLERSLSIQKMIGEEPAPL